MHFFLLTGLDQAIVDLKRGNITCPFECNLVICRCYNWINVTSRTEVVYNKIVRMPQITLGEQMCR